MQPIVALQSWWQSVWPHPTVVPQSDLRLVEQIQSAGHQLRACADGDLLRRAQDVRLAVAGRSMDAAGDVLVPALALAGEAVRRAWSVDLYDVQWIAAVALARGSIAEMQTGEGKTLAAIPAAFFYSLFGQGVHVATPNAYLAARDQQLAAAALTLVGARVGLVHDGASTPEKAAAYRCDVTYATGYELGFDFLRDQLDALSTAESGLGQRRLAALRGQLEAAPQRRQPAHGVAIVDEIDSVLIDEACLPLILSAAGPSPAADGRICQQALDTARRLETHRDFVVDPSQRRVALTACGQRAAFEHGRLAADVQLRRPWTNYVEQALVALLKLRRDVDYVVADGRILLVDEASGRIFPDRTWRDGLHQMLEAKEGLRITAEMTTAARISRQRFFQRYNRICGMTGTALGCEREFWNLYRLPIVVVPPRVAGRRSVLPTRFFNAAGPKWAAVVQQIETVHRTGRPVLVGSRTIENSLRLSQWLDAAAVPHQVLNGTQDESEATLIARAGARGAVTIATNMAGRGTDIKIAADVARLGGMHLIGAEQHEAQRIDRQLMGRVGRQGDPGSCQFFVSADDPLIELRAPDLARRMRAAPAHEGELHVDFSAEIAALQRRLEADRYGERRRLLAYDKWLVDDVLDTLSRRD